MTQPPDSDQCDDSSGIPAAIAARDELIAALQAQNALLVEQNAALVARVAELERRLGLNSGNRQRVARI